MARSGRGRRGPLGAAALAAALAVAATALAGPTDEAILPLGGYTARDARELAAAHAGELRALDAELRRCAADLEVRRHGIAFRRPRGSPATPFLTLWVWLLRGEPTGSDLAARAAAAFRAHSHALFRRLLARSPIFADGRVGGYGLVLSWLKPGSSGERLVAESLAVFADKLAVANFAHETIPASAFVARAEVRAFDGETELGSPRLALAEDLPLPSPAAC